MPRTAADVRRELNAALSAHGKAHVRLLFRKSEQAYAEWAESASAVAEAMSRPENAGVTKALAAAGEEDSAFLKDFSDKAFAEGAEPDPAALRELLVRLPALAEAIGGERGGPLLALFDRNGRAIISYREAANTLALELGKPKHAALARLAAELGALEKAEALAPNPTA